MTDARRVLDAIRYALRAGCAWRLLPREDPAAAPPRWQTVDRDLRAWERDGTGGRRPAARARGPPPRRARRRGPPRRPVGRDRRQPGERPSRCEEHGKGGPRGFDPGKRVVGRKRHILVDTLGLLIATRVEPANLHGSRTRDQRGAKGLLAGLAPLQPRLAVVYADGAYAGAHLRDWCAAHAGVELRVVRRPERHRFVVIPNRWIVDSVFSRHKRRLGSALTARRPRAQRRGTLLRVLTHNLMILRPGR